MCETIYNKNNETFLHIVRVGERKVKKKKNNAIEPVGNDYNNITISSEHCDRSQFQ